MPIRGYCSICIEPLENDSSVAAISCGHVFHLKCILDWLVSAPKLTCPHCRTDVGSNVIKLYFEFGEHDGHNLDGEWLKREEKRLNALLLLKEQEEKQWESMACSEQSLLDTANAEMEDLERSIRDMEALCSRQAEQLELLEQRQLETKTAMEETEVLKRKMRTMEDVEKMLESQRPDVETLMGQVGSSPDALAQLTEHCVSATREYYRLMEAHKQSAELNHHLKRELDASNNAAQEAEAEFQRLQEELNTTLMELNTFQNKIRASQLKYSQLAANEAPIGLQRPKLRLPGQVLMNSFSFSTETRNTICPPAFQRSARTGPQLAKVRAPRHKHDMDLEFTIAKKHLKHLLSSWC